VLEPEPAGGAGGRGVGFPVVCLQALQLINAQLICVVNLCSLLGWQ
jgi:hypothetical protein